MSARKIPQDRIANPGRRTFLKAGAAAMAGAVLPAGCFESNPRRPNLLLILTDDQRFDAIGYASGGAVMTPHLDRLAGRGTIFDAAYCNAMPCTPSRGSIISGLHWHRWKPLKKTPVDRLAPGEWTWAHALKQAGYRTGLIGKMHFSPMRANHGFSHAEYSEHQFSRLIAKGESSLDDYDQWLAERGLTDPHVSLKTWPHDDEFHPISWVRDRSIAYLDSQSGDDPFSLTISFRHPHPPFDPSRSYAELYDPAGIEVPTDHWTDMEGMPPKMRKFDGVGFFPREEFSRDLVARRIAYYFALITQIDAAVGRIMERVNLADTLVVFTSDHGVYLGRRGRVDKHPFLALEDVGRVPFFACGPGVLEGARVAHPIGLVDLAPTFLTAAGILVPEELDGESLQHYLADPSYGRDRVVFSRGASVFNMVRRGTHKYFRDHRREEEMLFDLASDPDELHNLAVDPGTASLRASLGAAMTRVEDRPPASLRRFSAA